MHERYFFDVIGPGHRYIDYRGQSLGLPSDALQVAEAIALDIENSDHEWSESQVEVRVPDGAHLYTVPVRHPDLIAW